MTVRFAVENAGCASCAVLVGDALAAVGTVESVDVDEAADVATLRLSTARPLVVQSVDRILAEVSEGSGHAYRVRPGSWIVLDRPT